MEAEARTRWTASAVRTGTVDFSTCVDRKRRNWYGSIEGNERKRANEIVKSGW